jgi:hypothetical protein
MHRLFDRNLVNRTHTYFDDGNANVRAIVLDPHPEFLVPRALGGEHDSVKNLASLSGVTLAQFPLEHLANGAAWQVVHELKR